MCVCVCVISFSLSPVSSFADDLDFEVVDSTCSWYGVASSNGGSILVILTTTYTHVTQTISRHSTVTQAAHRL